MQLIEWFVRNPVKVSVGVLLVALFGTIALLRMPMQLTPEVQKPTINITTNWLGASPQEVEREIIQEQEEQLKGVEGMTKMTSESSDSRGQISLEFLVGTDMSEALLKVNTRLQQVSEYPEDADEPVISTSSASDRPIAWFILSQRLPTDEALAAFQDKHPALREAIDRVRHANGPGLALLRLRDLAEAHPEAKTLLPEGIDVPKLLRFAEDFIESRFERVPGVADANVRGGREEEMQVVVDPQRLAARQLTISDLRSALRSQNQDTSGGDFWEGKRRYVVRTLGQFRTPAQVEEVIVAYRDGAPVFVRDVAKVRLGYKKPTGLVRRYGDTAIAVNCQRETGANVLDTMAGLREATADLNAGVLKQRGLQLTQVYDETDYIYSAVGLVKTNIVIAGFLTVAVLLLFLRSGRSTVVIGLAIPTSIIGTFLILNSLGRSLNVISLAGLAFAVGMLVDNSVVVLENIYRHYQRGDDVVTAAVRGAKEVWGAVGASTLTTLAVFLPVLFVEEEAGQLFRDIALAISGAVGLSLIVSVVVIPTAASKILRRQARGPRVRTSALSRAVGAMGRPLTAFGRGFVEFVVGVNGWLQRGALRRLGVVAGFVGTALVVSYLLMPKVEYLPNGNRNMVFGILLPPPGYNIEQVLEIGQRLESNTRRYWDWDPGDPELATLDFPPVRDFFFVAWGRRAFLGVRAEDPLRAGDLVPLIRQVGGAIPGTFVIAKQSSLFERGISAGRNIDVEIAGPDLTRLVALGQRVMGQVLQVVPGCQAFPNPSLDLSNPEVHVTPKLEMAAEMGVNNVDLGYAVNALVDGAYASDYFVGGDKIDLTIIGQERFVKRTQDLERLPILTPLGDLVPLAAVADVRLSSGPEQINHRERQRAITIEVTPPPEVALEEAMDRITNQIVRPLIDSGDLVREYQINLSGTADKLRATWQALRFNFLLALLITYLLMAALFESWLYPLVIIFSVPLGAVGGFAGLWLLNRFVLQPLDVLTMLGFVILVGTAVNNAILIVHQTLNHMRDESMPMRQAVLESVRSRIRPIFMTTSTTVLALLPLVLFPGAGSELYRGLGSVVLGGLTVSTLFTLFLVPSLFSLTMETRDGLLRLFRRRPPEAASTDRTRTDDRAVAS